MRRVRSALMAAVRQVDEEIFVHTEGHVMGGKPTLGDLVLQLDRQDRGRVRDLSKLRRRLLHAAAEVR